VGEGGGVWGDREGRAWGDREGRAWGDQEGRAWGDREGRGWGTGRGESGGTRGESVGEDSATSEPESRNNVKVTGSDLSLDDDVTVKLPRSNANSITSLCWTPQTEAAKQIFQV